MPIRIFADNQAAIRSVTDPQSGPCQFLVDDILNLFRELNRPLTIHWIPAHAGVPGNEEADAAAKEAAKIGLHALEKPLRPELTTAITAKAKRDAQAMWEERWEHSKRGRQLHRYLSELPKKKWKDKYYGLDRMLSSILVQMRTGKIGLNAYLHSIGKVDSPRCGCGARTTNQTVYHILMECRDYQDLRAKTLWQGRDRTRCGTGATDLGTMLSDPAWAKRAAIFMASTGLLGHLTLETKLTDTTDAEAQ